MGQSAGSRQIYLIIETSNTQSLQLFDFNAATNQIVTNELISSNTYITHDGENIKYTSKNEVDRTLYSVRMDEGLIEFHSSPDNEKYLWRVLKPGEVHPLEPGSYIKLGKVKLRLKEVVEDEKEITQRDIKSRTLNYYELAEVKSVSDKSQANPQEKVCRICFESTNFKQNPLVSLCKCMGTVKYLHYECLRDWTCKNLIKQHYGNTILYSYQEPKCQLCQKYYQAEFTYQGKRYSLLDMEEAPNPPYAVFQGIDYDEEAKRFSIFMVGLSEEEISIGRNSSSKVVMKEISVSRTHCSLLYRNKILHIRDKGSKFGTLIRAQDDIEFNPLEGISLQYESKLFTIIEKGNLNCCCVQSDTFVLRVRRDQPSSLYFEEG